MAENNSILDKLEGLVSRYEEGGHFDYRPECNQRPKTLRKAD